jgi:putative flippase GtrA
MGANRLKDGLKSIILYGVVGGIATIVEWVFFYILNSKLGVQYMLATTIAFIFSTFANWLSGRLIMFKKSENKSLLRELFQIYATSAAGLIMNLIIMYILVSCAGVAEMLSKMLATAIVFVFNYVVRKKFIYRN